MNGTHHRRVATTTATTTAPMSTNAGLGSMTYSSTTRPLSSPVSSASSSSSSSLSMWDVFLQECRAISAWVVLSAALRIALSDWIRWSDGQPGSFPHEPPAVLKDTARIVLSLLCPSGVAQNQTPGFVFGNGWYGNTTSKKDPTSLIPLSVFQAAVFDTRNVWGVSSSSYTAV